MFQFIIEIAVFLVIVILLKIYWSPTVRNYFMQTVLALNGIACFLYFSDMLNGWMAVADAMPKIVLHSAVMIIITTLEHFKKENDEN